MKRSSCAARFANGASCSDLSLAGIASAMIVTIYVGEVVWVVRVVQVVPGSAMHVVIGGRTLVIPASELWAAV